MTQLDNMSADAVIIGGGFAGMVAANRLAELGCKPLVLEQGAGAAYPCNSRYTGGALHVGFRDPVGRHPDELLNVIRARNPTASLELASAIANDARRLIAWLGEKGVSLAKAGAAEYKSWVLTPFRKNGSGIDWQDLGSDVALRTLTQRLLSRGGLLRLGTRAVAIDLQDSSVVIEARVGHEARQFRAKGVLIADGGFQANPDLIRRFIMAKPEDLVQRGAATGYGDGLRMALAAGAAAFGMDRFYGHLLPKEAFVNKELTLFPVADPMAQAAIVVDGSGRRFVDEGQGGVWIANNVARLHDPLSAVIIFDDAVWTGPAARGEMAPNPYMVDAGARILSAASIAQLAGAAGISVEGLTRTVDEYNAAYAATALEHLQPARTQTYGQAMPIAKAPFHALPVCVGITYTMGGISIDEHSRALDTEGGPLKRLYAAGCCTGGLEGGSSSGGYIGGMSKSGVTALRAAEHFANHCM